MLDGDAFTKDYLQQKDWLINSSFNEITQNAIAKISRAEALELTKLIAQKECILLNSNNLYLLEAECIQNYQLL